MTASGNPDERTPSGAIQLSLCPCSAPITAPGTGAARIRTLSSARYETGGAVFQAGARNGAAKTCCRKRRRSGTRECMRDIRARASGVTGPDFAVLPLHWKLGIVSILVKRHVVHRL